MNAARLAAGRPLRLETSAGPLEDGDCLNSKEFLRRCAALPAPAKLELVGGIVQIDALRDSSESAGPQRLMIDWLESYAQATPGVGFEKSPAVLLDRESVVQPDGALRVLPEFGGRTQISEKGCLLGAPELVAEVIFSRGINDLRTKLAAYRLNGVQEFIAWRFHERGIEWFQMERGGYVLNLPGPNNVLSSRAFPGLVVNATAMVAGDAAALRNTLKARLAAPEHLAYVRRLAGRKTAA